MLFAIRDNHGRYVHHNSLYYDKIDKKVVYDTYDTYIGTVLLYPEDETEKIITYMNQLALKLGLELSFNKELINI